MYPSIILKYILPALLVIVVIGHLATTWRHLDEEQSLAPGAHVVTGSPSIKSQAQPIASGNAGTPIDNAIGGILSGTVDEVVDTNPRVDVPEDGTGDGASHTTSQHTSSAVQSSTSSSQSPHGVTPQGSHPAGGQPAVIRTGVMSPRSPPQQVQESSSTATSATASQNNEAITQPGGGGAGNDSGVSNANKAPRKGGTSYPLEYEIYKQQNGASAFNEQILNQTNP
jgi:hypothetical protein